ncbi:MAG TPA: polysaccharide deacetylase family protein, partial [Desulfobacteraceae bacterium]|nr:polysaccharide deacetylase family protein [Desulfobacteraceae bacterium]
MSGLLLSVDLEDVRDWVRDGHRYQERVPVNTEAYLVFFARLRVKATFFVVGNVARRYPGLIRTIVEAGHELACHSDVHLQLDKQTAAEFRADVTRNRKTLEDVGGCRVTGYR